MNENNWEEEFDEKLKQNIHEGGFWYVNLGQPAWDNIKDFIRSEKAKSYQEGATQARSHYYNLVRTEERKKVIEEVREFLVMQSNRTNFIKFDDFNNHLKEIEKRKVFINQRKNMYKDLTLGMAIGGALAILLILGLILASNANACGGPCPSPTPTPQPSPAPNPTPVPSPSPSPVPTPPSSIPTPPQGKGGGGVWCSGPFSPGWHRDLPGGGCGIYISPGLQCPFPHGCVIPRSYLPFFPQSTLPNAKG